MKRYFLTVDSLIKEPYSKILGYPKVTKRQLESRIKELKKLKITKVSFDGSTKIGVLNVLGKGYVGIVVTARLESKTVALKIRRTDSQRQNMKNEAKLLEIANKANVGPKLITASRNFLAMELLDGKNIGSWISDVKGKGSASRVKEIIKIILEDAYNLDTHKIDHGELSSISKHVIVGKHTTIIDFESSSINRKVSNVTSATQGIYIGSGIAKKLNKIYKIPPRDDIIESLRNYKKHIDRDNFEEVLKVLKL